MGNRASSGVTSGVKDQAAGVTKELYYYIDLNGGGKLVELMKKANRTKNFDELQRYIKSHMIKFLYNDGNGKRVHIKEIVQHRARDRGLKLTIKKDDHDSDNHKNANENGYCGSDKSKYEFYAACFSPACTLLIIIIKTVHY